LNPAKAASLLEKAKEEFAAVDVNDGDAYREASDKLISAQAMVDSVVAKHADI
jgi:F-type H+-transporting ATPase subunit epsilon